MPARRFEVEMDDGPQDAVPAGPSRARPRRWRWWAAVATAVVLLAGAQVVVDARDRAALTALAGVEGLVDAPDGPVAVAWRVDPALQVRSGARVGGSLVAARTGADGAVRVEAVDVTTGAPVWGVEVVPAHEDADAVPGDAPVGGEVPCVPLPAGRVVCLVEPGTAEPRLVVLSVTDGALVLDRGVPAPAVSVTPAGDDDVVLTGAAGGEVHVRAWDLDDDVERWRTTLPDVPGDPATSAVLLDERTLAVQHGDVTLVSTGGAVLRRVAAQVPTLLTGAGVSTSVRPSPALGVVVVRDAQGTSLVGELAEQRVDGSPLPTPVDDGSVPGLVLTRTPRLQAWDASDGTPRWGATLVDAQDATVLRGRVHVGTSRAVVTFDGRTGAELWRVPRATATGPVVSDGSHLFVQVMRDGRHRAPYDLVALDVADGRERWRVPLPGDAALTTDGRLLAVVTPDPPTVRVLR